MFHFTFKVMMDWHFECVCRKYFGRMRRNDMDYKAMEKVVEFAKSRRNRRGMWKFVRDYGESYFTDLIHMLEQKAFRRRHPNFDRTFKKFFIKSESPYRLADDTECTEDDRADCTSPIGRTITTYLASI